MTRIDKEAIKARKEASRAIQYPRIVEEVEVIVEPTPVVEAKPKKTKNAKKSE